MWWVKPEATSQVEPNVGSIQVKLCGFYQCWAGLRKEVRTSQGFKPILVLNASWFHKG